MSSRSAFSLVELSFVIAIVALLTVGGLSVGVTVLDQKRHVDTKVQLEEVQKALEDFYRVNGRLPCPANRTLQVSNSNFGKEVTSAANCSTDNATVYAGVAKVATSGANHFVRIGALPVRALGLKDTATRDQWLNNFTYAVLGEATDSSTLGALMNTFVASSTQKGIFINEVGGTTKYDQALYAVISHGMNGLGATRFKSGAVPPSLLCNALKGDGDNCDDDRNIVDSTFSDSTTDANYFDDYVTWGSVYSLKGNVRDGLGVGQTYTNVAATRVCDTVYTNNTGKPIFVAVTSISNGSAIPAVIGGVTYNYAFSPTGTAAAGSFIVPDAVTYRVNCTSSGSGFTSWVELR